MFLRWETILPSSYTKPVPKSREKSAPRIPDPISVISLS